MATLVAVGANLSADFETRVGLVLSVVSRLKDEFGGSAKCSRLYRTPAYPPGSGADFVNAVIRLHTDRAPQEILTLLHQIEADHGRVRQKRWAARSLDLDLLAQGATVLPDLPTWGVWRGLSADQQQLQAPSELILPHPRLQDRAFVLVPLCDVAPDWLHPVLNRSARDLCAALSPQDRAEIVACA